MNVIIEHKVSLIKWLRGDGLILQHVQSKTLITNDEYATLDNIQDSTKQITKLLDLILGKGSGVCTAFLNLLKEDNVNESMPELREWIITVNTSSASSESNARGNLAQAGRQNVRVHATDNQPFLKKNRSDLVQKVKNVAEIADELVHFSDEQRANLKAEKTDQAKMRLILDYTNSKKAADLLVQALYKHADDVMEELSSD